jgi:hypothetical protein
MREKIDVMITNPNVVLKKIQSQQNSKRTNSKDKLNNNLSFRPLIVLNNNENNN